MAEPIKNVMLVGASGLFGTHVLSALQSQTLPTSPLSPRFTITALTRASSTNTFSPAVKTLPIPDDYPQQDLIAAFRGQDAVILTLPGRPTSDLQIRMIDAAVQAGTKRFIPSIYGCNTSPVAGDIVGLYADENRVIKYLREKSRNQVAGWEGIEAKGQQLHGLFSWTILHPGQFFDWGLESTWLCFDIKKRKAVVYGSGERRWSTSTIDTAALAIAECLVHEEETRNKEVRVASFTVCQNQVLEALEGVMGKWEVERVDCGEARRRIGEMGEDGEEWWGKLKGQIMVLLGEDEGGERGLEFEKDRDGLWNERLGLGKEDLGVVVERVVRKVMGQ